MVRDLLSSKHFLFILQKEMLMFWVTREPQHVVIKIELLFVTQLANFWQINKFPVDKSSKHVPGQHIIV